MRLTSRLEATMVGIRFMAFVADGCIKNRCIISRFVRIGFVGFGRLMGLVALLNYKDISFQKKENKSGTNIVNSVT